MPDMLVKLYELPDYPAVLASQRAMGIDIRRCLGAEKHVVTSWVRQHFNVAWQSETEVSFSRVPLACFIATEGDTLLGFACYDVVRKGFFGPTGVDEAQRKRGIGKALLLACMDAMWHEGYGYAIIAAAGPTGFYERSVNAVAIPDSSPGVFRGMLKGD